MWRRARTRFGSWMMGCGLLLCTDRAPLWRVLFIDYHGKKAAVGQWMINRLNLLKDSPL